MGSILIGIEVRFSRLLVQWTHIEHSMRWLDREQRGEAIVWAMPIHRIQPAKHYSRLT
jgi:hypothetical protein